MLKLPGHQIPLTTAILCLALIDCKKQQGVTWFQQPWRVHRCYSDLPDKKTETRRGESTCPKSHPTVWDSDQLFLPYLDLPESDLH